MTALERRIRRDVRMALDSCNMAQMNRVMVAVGVSGVDLQWAEKMAQEELNASTHEVQRFWLSDCNCHGQQN